LVGKPEGERSPGRPRRRWMVDIKMGLRGIGWNDMDWIDLPWDRGQWRTFVNTVMSVRVP
jgi:transposase